MKKIALGIVGFLAVIFLAAVLIPIDPEDQRPGTRLSGALVDASEVDWSFVEPGQLVTLQTATWYLIPHSVTTFSIVSDGELYIPCGWCGSKRWPKNVATNPDVIVKIGESLYERRAVQVDRPELIERVFKDMDVDTSEVALYRLAPRQ